MLPVVAALIGLGVWQVERRTWKLKLIAQVEQRLHAAPVAAPGPDQWPRIAKADSYTRVSAHGVYRQGADTLVQAVTDLGAGYWVLTPMVTDRGFTLLVNRGFVPQEMRAHPPAPAAGETSVSGLLRVSEPGGAFLRSNDAADDRWYSRDVAAIARKRGVSGVAPYFVDADADAAKPAGWPRGGLTVVQFPNNHLQYALTWFAMAALLGFTCLRMILKEPVDRP